MSCIPKYKFSKEIESQLQEFKSFMATNGLEENTVRQHGNYTGIYLEWISKENIEIREARYKDIIAFIQSLQSKNNNPKFINRVVLAVRHYYQYLSVPKNPAAGIFIRGATSKVPIDIVSYPEIINLYEQYQGLDNRTKRNRVMLGLMVYQAVTTRELHHLEPHHIKLKEAKIYIPGTNRSLARVLPIRANQLLELSHYLEVIRVQLQRDIYEVRSGRVMEKVDQEAIDNQLFFSERGNGNIKSSLYHMFRQIKKINRKITSGKVIRQSVITEWTKTIGIRQVQYMAGYRCVGSVERCKQYNLEELTEELNEFHPLK